MDSQLVEEILKIDMAAGPASCPSFLFDFRLFNRGSRALEAAAVQLAHGNHLEIVGALRQLFHRIGAFRGGCQLLIFAVLCRRFPIRNGPVFVETAEMIETDDIEKFRYTGNTVDPPFVAG